MKKSVEYRSPRDIFELLDLLGKRMDAIDARMESLEEIVEKLIESVEVVDE